MGCPQCKSLDIRTENNKHHCTNCGKVWHETFREYERRVLKELFGEDFEYDEELDEFE